MDGRRVAPRDSRFEAVCCLDVCCKGNTGVRPNQHVRVSMFRYSGHAIFRDMSLVSGPLSFPKSVCVRVREREDGR